MSDDEGKAREALEAGRIDEALVYVGLAQVAATESINQRLYTLLVIAKRQMMAAESGTPNGIILIHRSYTEPEPTHDVWEGSLRHRGLGPSSMKGSKDDVLRWARSRPADVCLIQDPETGDWSQWPPADGRTHK